MIVSMAKVLCCWSARNGPLESKQKPWAKVSTESVEHKIFFCVLCIHVPISLVKHYTFITLEVINQFGVGQFSLYMHVYVHM